MRISNIRIYGHHHYRYWREVSFSFRLCNWRYTKVSEDDHFLQKLDIKTRLQVRQVPVTELPYFVYAKFWRHFNQLFSLSASIPSLGFVLSTDRLCSALKVLQSLAGTAKKTRDLSLKMSSGMIKPTVPEAVMSDKVMSDVTETLISTVMQLNKTEGRREIGFHG